ncbi:MAG: 50S ribosomal protein L29 [Candidatus Micrarchaeota archaeon]|nr:50S ribosomal protein L29 [Candidatus Micrarchaeota archaeon]
MAVLKKQEINKMQLQELEEKLQTVKNELNKELSAKNVPGKAFNNGKVRELKKTIARILTRIKQLKTNTN